MDISTQQSVLQASQSMMLAHPFNASHITRVAGGAKFGGVHLQLSWPCKDGFVSVTFLFGAGIGPFTRNLMNWIHEEGFCDEATHDKDWINYANLLFGGVQPMEEYTRVKSVVGTFLATKTKAELLAAAFERRLLIVPVSTTEDVVTSPQLADRGFWQDVDHGGRTVRYPGPIARFSATPLSSLPAAPALGARHRRGTGCRGPEA